MKYTLMHGDNRAQLKHLADNSIDSIVCDPPYELGFMGKRWDSTGIAYDLTVWTECLRVLKPGGHLIAFGGTRTYHRMTVAIEDAGFEIRDCIMWLYGSGFPKSLNVSKAFDRKMGLLAPENKGFTVAGYSHAPDKLLHTAPSRGYMPPKPATDLAKQWHGWGTALKPAVEPAVLARKPLSGTVADNVTTWGVGGLNIDGCRVGDEIRTDSAQRKQGPYTSERTWSTSITPANNDIKVYSGRWPANVILDEDAGEALDEQSGQLSMRFSESSGSKGFFGGGKAFKSYDDGNNMGASRFFYTAKASKAEREAGLEGMETKVIQDRDKDGNLLTSEWRSDPRSPNGGYENKPTQPRANHHPTVKPIALMRYLVRLVTPKDGTVLDPFMGSGSTGCAAMCEGMNFVGIELSEEYLEIARRRIEYWQSQNPMGL